jgi:hypothetical protein
MSVLDRIRTLLATDLHAAIEHLGAEIDALRAELHGGRTPGAGHQLPKIAAEIAAATPPAPVAEPQAQAQPVVQAEPQPEQQQTAATTTDAGAQPAAETQPQQ